MTQIELSPDVVEDFDRILRHLAEHDVEQRSERIDDLISALDVLASSPLIGRPCRGTLRELIIGRGARGYVALYRYLAVIDTVFVLAIRSQREVGYAHEAGRSGK